MVAGSAIARQPEVVFINPGAEHAADLWGQMPRLMGEAAKQLAIRLEVLNANRDRLQMVELARQVATRPKLPDYVVLVNEKQRAPAIMELFRGTPTRLLLLHNDLTPEQRAVWGNERERLPNWIGTIVSDDVGITRALMEGLYRKGTAQPAIVGIGGDDATPVSAQRESAMRNFVAQTGRGTVLQVVPGNWTREDARGKAQGLLQRYPSTTMIWTANDTMALGALDAVMATRPKNKIVVGGVGAFPEALKSIAEGGLTITAGGFDLAGAWSMVMIHDYEQAHDFAKDNGPRIVSGTILVANDAISAARIRALSEHPARIDFRRFSLAENPRLKTYDFSAPALFAASR